MVLNAKSALIFTMTATLTLAFAFTLTTTLYSLIFAVFKNRCFEFPALELDLGFGRHLSHVFVLGEINKYVTRLGA